MAINEKSEKFWYEVNDNVSMGRGLGGMEKNGRSMESIENLREYGRVYMVGEVGNFWKFGDSSQVWGKNERSGEVWGEEWVNVLRCGKR